jgi:hypothetical protein
MTNNNSSSWLGLAASAFLTLAGNADAISTFYFTRISTNSADNVASQLSVDVADAGANQVSFTFRNAVGIASSITDIYFDDGTLLGISSVTNGGAGVDFSLGASPGDLPNGNAVGFVTSAGFSADSNPPAAANGVNSSSEFVTVLFNLIGGQTYADTIAAMNLSLANPGVDVTGGLRIGLHVQAIGGDGNSDAFVNTGTSRPGLSVPDGGTTLVLLGSAMAGLGFIMRKSSK